jgi:glutamyl-tRNA reductase
MTTDQEMAVEALTRGIVNKIMHTPISTLKTAARDPESTTVIELVRRLFNLHTEEHEEIAAAQSGRGQNSGKGSEESSETGSEKDAGKGARN